jgi:hypothetical protein
MDPVHLVCLSCYHPLTKFDDEVIFMSSSAFCIKSEGEVVPMLAESVCLEGVLNSVVIAA